MTLKYMYHGNPLKGKKLYIRHLLIIYYLYPSYIKHYTIYGIEYLI